MQLIVTIVALLASSAPEPWVHRPARGYTWEQFQEGNLVSKRHGAFSPRTWQPMARQLVEGVLEESPWLARYPELLRSWSDAWARAELLRAWLDENCVFDADGEPRKGPLYWLDRFDAAAQKYGAELGLTPRSEAEIAKIRAEATRTVADLDAVATSGAASLAQRTGITVADEPEDAP